MCAKQRNFRVLFSQDVQEVLDYWNNMLLTTMSLTGKLQGSPQYSEICSFRKRWTVI